MFVDEASGGFIDPGSSNDSTAYSPPCYPTIPMEVFLQVGYEPYLRYRGVKVPAPL